MGYYFERIGVPYERIYVEARHVLYRVLVLYPLGEFGVHLDFIPEAFNPFYDLRVGQAKIPSAFG